MGDFFQNAENAIAGFGANVSSAGAQLLHTAQNEARLFGDFVNGKVTGPAAARFGSDPIAFVHNVVRHDVSTWVGVANDVARRRAVAHYTVVDPRTGKPTQIPATLKGREAFNVIVLTVALAALKDPAVFIDAAGRRATGVGGGRGIDDVHWWPVGAPRGALGFVEGIPLPTPTDLAALAAIATIIAAIASVVVPVLVSAVGFVKNVIAPPPPPRPPESPGIFGIPPLVLLVVAAAGIALVLLWHPKAAVAAAGG